MNQMMPAPQPTGGYNFPQAPAGVMTIPPALSGGYYNQMAQMMAGPNYQMPHFQFTGLSAGGSGMGNGGPPNAPFQQSPLSGPASGIGTGMGPYAFGGSGSGDIGGMGSYAPFVGGGGSYANGFPTSLTLGGGNITGGYTPPSSSHGLLNVLATIAGGALGGAPGALGANLLSHYFGSSSGTGGLTLPNGTTLPTQNMHLQPTSIPMPVQNINLAQQIINPATGMPYGTAYGETPQGAQALATEQAFSNQANSYTQEAMNPALRGGRHLRL